MLNSRQLIEEKIVTGPIDNDMIQQVGIDLRVINISGIFGGGIIPQKGKTTIGQTEGVKKVAPDKSLGLENGTWCLNPGAYEVEFEQGCDIPANRVLLIRQRSSLLRNGAILHSSVFDPGFKTDSIGTVLIVHAPIAIEFKARIAQIYGYECKEVNPEDLYDGQFQGDKQRKIPSVSPEQLSNIGRG